MQPHHDLFLFCDTTNLFNKDSIFYALDNRHASKDRKNSPWYSTLIISLDQQIITAAKHSSISLTVKYKKGT